MNRIDLHNELLKICNHVYFQPPENLKIEYPAIVYHRTTIQSLNANNEDYNIRREYEITVIDKNPDSTIVGKVNKLKYCKHIRTFRTTGLNHDVYRIYNIEGD